MKVERGRPAVRAKLIDFVLMAAAGVLVLVIVGLSAFGAFFSELASSASPSGSECATPSGLFLRDGVQLVAILVTVLLLYRFVPARELRRRGALAGAILTAVGIWGATKVLAIIFADFSRYNLIYGSLAGVMTFLFFVYVVAGSSCSAPSSRTPGLSHPARRDHPCEHSSSAVVRGLFVHQPTGAERPSEEPARRP